VLIRKFGSIVGTSVWVGAGEVGDWENESTPRWERDEAMVVQETGRNGVGVGDGFGADVTKM
jgi:hypothetical protein